MTGPEHCKQERPYDKLELEMIEKSKLIMSHEDSFSHFWASYPKKQAKPTAYKAWCKLKLTRQLYTEIMVGLGKWKMTHAWLKNEGQFVPLPSSWLNQERWNDEVEVSYNKKAPQGSVLICRGCGKTNVAMVDGKCIECYQDRDNLANPA